MTLTADATSQSCVTNAVAMNSYNMQFLCTPELFKK